MNPQNNSLPLGEISQGKKELKKVLIITYYWPPAGGPGVQRWLKFVKYLPEFNIEPIVYIPENPNYPRVDESLNSEVPDAVTILKHPISEPYKWARMFSKSSKTISRGIISDHKSQSFIERLLLFIRGNFFIPDARIRWVKPSVAYLSKYISDNHIDTIITTGPPHSVHLIGLKLKENLGTQWFADFRDPWTTIGYHKQLKLTEASRKKHKLLEKQIIDNADHLIVTSSVTKKEFQAITNTSITVITNGYDVEESSVAELDSKFTISHIGSLLSKRNPHILWLVLKELISENEDFASDFQLNLVGEVSDYILLSRHFLDISDHVNKVGYVSHKESIEYQKKSQLLLLIEIDSPETVCIIPGKLFEYMVSNRPILALGPKGSDVESIIIETNSGHYFYYSDYESLKSTILEHYKAFKHKSLQSYPIGLQKYSRKALTQHLAELIKNQKN